MTEVRMVATPLKLRKYQIHVATTSPAALGEKPMLVSNPIVGITVRKSKLYNMCLIDTVVMIIFSGSNLCCPRFIILVCRICFICFNVVSYPNLCFNISLVIYFRTLITHLKYCFDFRKEIYVRFFFCIHLCEYSSYPNLCFNISLVILSPR
jgi:hypothetical protein